MPLISSAQNSIYKSLVELTKSKGIREQGRALVSGDKITHEIARLGSKNFWIYNEDHTPHSQNPQTIFLTNTLFTKLDVCGTQKPILCVEYPPLKPISQLQTNEATLYVGLSDPNNLGALLRTCAAFDWPQVVLLKESAHPFLPKAIRASSGTCFATTLFSGPSIHDLNDPEIVALDRGGIPVESSLFKKNLKLLVGEEGQGIPTNFKGTKWAIPISNKVESLNATIATSLIVYQWSQQC